MEHRQSRRKRGKRRPLLVIGCVILAIIILLGGTILVLRQLGKTSLFDDGKKMTMQEDDSDTVTYKGQKYRYNSETVSVLLMGVDKYGKKDESGVFGRPLQSDVNVLAVLDFKHNKITLISISRDSMCHVSILDDDGNYVETATAQLALAYSYGDGGDISCQLTRDSVSELFYNLPIQAYGSIYMDGIIELIDEVGGVTVTVDDDTPYYSKGDTVTLYGKSAEQYLRYREHTVDGNNGRMHRQKQVIIALMKTMLAKAKENPASVITLYGNVKDSVTTDMDLARITYLATKAGGMKFNDTVLNVPGKSTLGESGFAEYNVDKTALYELILQTFYEPVEAEKQ